jgi:lysyl-tRNA synthetase class 2
MIAELLTAAPSRDVSRMSLNFAVFRSSLARGERIDAGLLPRARVPPLCAAAMPDESC